MARVLQARARDHFLERLPLDEFVRVIRLLDSFINDCNVLRRMTTKEMAGGVATAADADEQGIVITVDKATAVSPLRTALRNQMSAFVGAFHADRKEKLKWVILSAAKI